MKSICVLSSTLEYSKHSEGRRGEEVSKEGQDPQVEGRQWEDMGLAEMMTSE